MYFSMFSTAALSGTAEIVGQDQHNPKAAAEDDASARQISGAATEDVQQLGLRWWCGVDVGFIFGFSRIFVSKINK
jgi:hypothetical protein